MKKYYQPKYVKVKEGKFEGWTGYMTGRFTENGTPKLLLYDGHGKEVVVAVNEKEFDFIRPFKKIIAEKIDESRRDIYNRI